MSGGAWATLLSEVGQRHAARRGALLSIEQALGRRLVSYFVSLADPAAMIDHADSDVLEEALRQFDPGDRRGLTLLLNAPGGDGLAAERIVRVLRTYAGGDLEVIVPRMAKSAATMVCFGADAIWMSATSELGPIDPQVGWTEQDRVVRCSARELIESYEKLLLAAESCQGNIEPYLQQLGRYDARLVETCRSAEALSVSIAVGLLSQAMMRGAPEAEIEGRIRPFIEGKETRSHARAIYHDRAAACGLTVHLLDVHEPLWQRVWELYLRASYVVDSTPYSKLIETCAHSFSFAPKDQRPEIQTEGGY